MPELVNTVGGGDLGREIDLSQVSTDLNGEIVRYDPEQWPGIYYRITSDSPTIMIFSSGKYNIAGAKSIDELFSTKEKFLGILSDLGISISEHRFEVRNLVYLGDYEKEFDLELLSIGLGLEKTEYEPEQFPALIYKPDKYSGMFLIFRTGKILSTGSDSEMEINHAFNDLFSCLDDLIQS